ncbi:hypothetical protein PT974_05003 [Cladobotryum mycophilum]|uniref:Uncharacterized protein n=1 Tax=Cladobotryum mycophilum TaxID=491253 RepID=A0ABR0SQR9_9HYPO
MFMADLMYIRASLDIKRSDKGTSSSRSSISEASASAPPKKTSRPRPQVKAAACGGRMTLPQLKLA